MFDRATVERNSETGTDAHGHPLAAVWTFYLSLHCRVYNGSKTLIVDGKKTATVEALRIAYPLDATITRSDRITLITDRSGRTLYSGNYELSQITRKYTHYEADLKAVE
jgi:hypothetical protein